MTKGKLIVDIEKIDDEIKTANLKIEYLTIEELSHVVGSVLNNVISENSENEAEEVFLKAHALHDICVRIGFETTAASLERVFDGLEREGK